MVIEAKIEPKVGSSIVVRNGLQAYLRTRVEGASEGELLLATYDMAIAGCARQDDATASGCLAELMNALNFDYHEVSPGLFRLYRYCLDLVKAKKWEEAAAILRELRQVWAQALGYPTLHAIK